MRFIKAVAVSIFILTVISCKQNSNNSKFIATSSVGNVMFSEFESQMLKMEFDGDILKAASSKMEQRERFINNMLMDKIINDVAEKNKLDNVEVVKSEYRKRLYYDAIVNHLVVDSVQSKIFNEKEIKATYEKKKIKYLPKHILIAVEKKRTDSQAKSKIDSIYKQLMEGTEFSDLAKKYSSDVKTGKNGGELGWLHSYDLLEEFENVLTTMNKGDISKPFKTKYGYHIVYLTDKEKNEDLKSFEEERGTIVKELTQKYSREFAIGSQKFLDKLIPRLNVKIDTLGIKTLVKQYRKNEKEFESTGKDPILNFSTPDRKKILASFSDTVIDIDTLLTMLGSVEVKKRPPLNNLNNVISILKNILKIEMLEVYSDQLGYTSLAKVVSKAKGSLIPVYRKVLLDQIKSKIEVSDAEIEKFYKKNKEKYKTPEGYDPLDKVKVGIKNSIKARKLNKKVKEWESDLYKKYNVKINKILLEESFYHVTDDKK